MDLDVGRHFLGGDNAVGFDEGRPLALVSNTRGKGNRMPVIELKKVEDGYYVGQIYGLDVEITHGRRISPEMAPIRALVGIKVSDANAHKWHGSCRQYPDIQISEMCPSSKYLRLLSVFNKRDSGSSLVSI